jgi:ubiquitin carboxyl-terminal hydrolase 5/13
MERAVEWLFSHPDEPPVDLSAMDTFDTNANATDNVPADKVAGYSAKPAQYRLQSVIMHKGSSVHTGHYVAFIRKDIPGVGEDWVLFNDEKVVRGGDWNEVYKTGYVYFFRRV